MKIYSLLDLIKQRVAIHGHVSTVGVIKWYRGFHCAVEKLPYLILIILHPRLEVCKGDLLTFHFVFVNIGDLL